MIDPNMDDADELTQHIKHLIAERGHIPSKVASKMEEALLQVVLDDAPLLPPELFDKMYTHGYHLFQSGKYNEALPIFNLLRELNREEIGFTFAIAACHHHLNHYEDAAGYYMLYESSDLANPLPYYHMYDCFTKMGQPLLAANALQQASHLAKEHPQYAELKVRVDLELEHLKSLESRSEQKQESSTA